MDKKKVLSKFPRTMRLKLITFYLARKRRLLNTVETPAVLTFFVTSRCNLRCIHCFYWKELNKFKGEELSLTEIDKIVLSLRKKVSLAITGGEPFLRKDLVEICELFFRHKKVREIGIVTNGYDVKTIISQSERILSRSSVPISIQVSIDGMEETHDEIRGVAGSFRHAVETVKELKKIQGENRDKLKVSAAFAIQKKNYNEVEAFIDLMLPLKIPLHFLIVRGEDFGLYGLHADAASHINPRVKESADIPVSALQEVFEKIKKKNAASVYRFWSLKQQKIIDLSLEILKTRVKQMPCYSGILEGILYSNGDVSFCEFMKPIGNLRDYNYDFCKLWNSEGADRLREVARRCFCIHSCALGTSLLLNDPEVADDVIFGKDKIRSGEDRWVL